MGVTDHFKTLGDGRRSVGVSRRPGGAALGVLPDRAARPPRVSRHRIGRSLDFTEPNPIFSDFGEAPWAHRWRTSILIARSGRVDVMVKLSFPRQDVGGKRQVLPRKGHSNSSIRQRHIPVRMSVWLESREWIRNRRILTSFGNSI